MLDKEQIRDRLQTDAFWVTNTRTALTGAIAERLMKYVVALYINGNTQIATGVMIEKMEEGTPTTYTVKFSHINVPAADNIQVPKDGFSITDPVLTLEGGTRLYASTLVSGHSVNLSVIHWDNDI